MTEVAEYTASEKADSPTSLEFAENEPGYSMRSRGFVAVIPDPSAVKEKFDRILEEERRRLQEPVWFTEEESRFLRGLQDTEIAEAKFFESIMKEGDLGTPYTVREMFAKGRRQKVQEYLIGRYLFNNGIGDDHGVLPVDGDVKRYFARLTGRHPKQINFTYMRVEKYCRDHEFSERLTREILDKASALFGHKPEFYEDTSMF